MQGKKFEPLPSTAEPSMPIWVMDFRELGYSLVRPDNEIYNFAKPGWEVVPAAITADHVKPMPIFANGVCNAIQCTYLLDPYTVADEVDEDCAVITYSLDSGGNLIEQAGVYPVRTAQSHAGIGLG